MIFPVSITSYFHGFCVKSTSLFKLPMRACTFSLCKSNISKFRVIVPKEWLYDYMGHFIMLLRFLKLPHYPHTLPNKQMVICYNRMVELLGANKAGLTSYLVPVIGTTLAITLLGEQFRTYHLAGIALILVGVLLGTRSPREA